MGQRKTAIAVARQNIEAFREISPDYIITLCASCAGQLKHHYPEILAGPGVEEVKKFADRINIDALLALTNFLDRRVHRKKRPYALPVFSDSFQ